MLLDDCIEFGFCQECNANLFRRLSKDQNAFVHGGALSDVRRNIAFIFSDGYYDPDLERQRAVLSIQVERSRVCREESEQVEREKAAKEAALRELEDEARRKSEEAFKAKQRALEGARQLERPCRPMQLKHETVQITRQQEKAVKGERKYSSELSRIVNSHQKKEDHKLAHRMQSWLKTTGGSVG
tara:strand:- start:1011 stop:1565 length:555 start_codon:yes stop_codon:yes gene_type:complete